MPGPEAVFQPDQKANRYVVHLVHQLKRSETSAKAVEVIHCINTLGQELRPIERHELKFYRLAWQDLVTGEKQWLSDWQAEKANNFNELLAPEIKGFHSLLAKLPAVSVKLAALKPDQPQLIVKTFVYVKQHQLQGKAVLTLVDATKKQPVSSSVVSGEVGQKIVFESAVTNQLAKFEANGWKVAASNWQAGLKFTDKPQQFVIQLAHREQSQAKQICTVQRLVEFVLTDGTNLPVPPFRDQIKFSRHGNKDKVTGENKWQAWQAEKQWSEVKLPKVSGFAPTGNLRSPKINNGQLAVDQTVLIRQQVIYQRLSGSAEFILIDTSSQQELTKVVQVGPLAAEVKWPEQAITKWEQDGYKVIDSNWAQTAKFTTKLQKFTIHLCHGIKQLRQQAEAVETVDFVLADGRPTELPTNRQVIIFTRVGQQDLVTKEISWDNWSTDQSFQKVEAPTLANWRPEPTVILPKEVDLSQLKPAEPLLLKREVIYHPQTQTKDANRARKATTVIQKETVEAPKAGEQVVNRSELATRAALRKQRRHAARRTPGMTAPLRRPSRWVSRLVRHTRFY